MKSNGGTLDGLPTHAIVPATESHKPRELPVPRFGWLALLPIVLSTLPGCLRPEKVESSNWMRQFKNAAISPDQAFIEVAMIQADLGDEYLDEKIWEHTDEMVDFKKRGILHDNGFRVGQLVGTPPKEFQKLLLSPRACSNPQALIFPPGRTAPIQMPRTQAQLTYDLIQNDERTTVTLRQARCGFDVAARFDKEGRTILTFTPKVEHDAPALPFHAAAESSTWELRTGKAAKIHPELSWEVTLGANQYVLVGPRLDRDKTLGQLAFIDMNDDREVQWLLVVRNCRAATPAEAKSTSAESPADSDRTPPLAIQAMLPSSPGKGQR